MKLSILIVAATTAHYKGRNPRSINQRAQTRWRALVTMPQFAFLDATETKLFVCLVANTGCHFCHQRAETSTGFAQTSVWCSLRNKWLCRQQDDDSFAWQNSICLQSTRVGFWLFCFCFLLMSEEVRWDDSRFFLLEMTYRPLVGGHKGALYKLKQTAESERKDEGKTFQPSSMVLCSAAVVSWSCIYHNPHDGHTKARATVNR